MSLQSAFAKKFGYLPALSAHAPGRVNLLGEHVDYNDGPVLPVALDMAVKLAFTPTQDGNITLYALDLGKRVTFTVESIQEKKDKGGNRNEQRINHKIRPYNAFPAGAHIRFQKENAQSGGGGYNSRAHPPCINP